MALYILDILITNAGKAHIADLASKNQKIDINRVDFGTSRAAPSPTTSNVGSIIETTRSVLPSSGLMGGVVEIHLALSGGDNDEEGMIGIYTNTGVLLGVTSFLLPARQVEGQARNQVILRFTSEHPSVFSASKPSLSSATHVSEIWYLGSEDILNYFNGAAPHTGNTVFGTATGVNKHASFVNHIFTCESASEEATIRSILTSEGSTYYDLRTWREFKRNGGVWTSTNQTLNDILTVGTFYHCSQFGRIYYARGFNDMLKVVDPARA